MICGNYIYAIVITWVFSAICLVASTIYFDSAETKRDTGYEDALWGLGFLISGIILAILASILMIIKYKYGSILWDKRDPKNSSDQEHKSNKEIEIPEPVIFVDD